MATLKFFLRKSTRGSSYTGKICARIIHNRKVRVITLSVQLYPHEWDERQQLVLLGSVDAPCYDRLCQAKQALNDCLKQFDELVDRLEKQGRYGVDDLFLGSLNRRALLGLQGYTEHLARNLNKGGQERTARAYLTTCRILIAFNKGRDIPLKHINGCLVKEFENHLKESGKSMNTISYYIRMLRAIYHRAVKEQLVECKRINPFEGSFTGFQRTNKRALSLEQLRRLNELDFSIPLMGRVRRRTNGVVVFDKDLYDCWRYFFFCFYARGMSFVDLAYLRKENLSNGLISYYRKKTRQKIEITITPVLQQIIDSFVPEVYETPYLFPIIRDSAKSARLQYETGLTMQNKRLKRLAKLADVELDWGLSTHVSRHSWATMGKLHNLPLSVISEGLGHSSEKMTYVYLASFDRSTLDKASKRIDQAIIGSSGLLRQLHTSL